MKGQEARVPSRVPSTDILRTATFQGTNCLQFWIVFVYKGLTTEPLSGLLTEWLSPLSRLLTEWLSPLSRRLTEWLSGLS